MRGDGKFLRDFFGWMEKGSIKITHKVHVDVTSKISSKRILILSFMKVKVLSFFMCFLLFVIIRISSRLFSLATTSSESLSMQKFAFHFSSPSGAFQLRDENLNSRKQMMIMSSWWKLVICLLSVMEVQNCRNHLRDCLH